MNRVDTPEPGDDLQRAIEYHEAGRITDAEDLYKQILQRDPSEPDALNLLGLILQERGDFQRSAELISRAIEAEPDFPEALANLARARHALGQLEEARDLALSAEALDPELPEAPLILCRALLDLNEGALAAEAASRAVARAPGLYETHYYHGEACASLKDWPGAIAAFQTALDLQPWQVKARVMLAGSLSEMNQLPQAIQLFQEAASAAPNELPPYIGLGVALERSADIPGSVAAFQRALELAPRRADIWRLQGSNYDALGQFDEAAKCYRQSLALDPASTEARRNLAKIDRLADTEAEAVRLETEIKDESLPTWDRIAAGFALGTLHDKAGAYDDAFRAYAIANDLTRALQASRNEVFDRGEFSCQVTLGISGFDRFNLSVAGKKGDPSELPVFIVGMPRSGTTLVEQILASHPRVLGQGETLAMPDMVRRLEHAHPGVHPVLWNAHAIRHETENHLAQLRSIGVGYERVTDKLPDNVLVLAQISILFPGSRVIMCRRDLRDVCLSCYFQHFKDPTPWSLDLADCAARARDIDRLMNHWRTAVPLRLLEVGYEELVTDLEGQSRRLIDFLGLEWDPTCLSFHETKRTVLTASQWQVRQPVYATSVGRWKLYRNHIASMLSGLKGIVPPDVDDDRSDPTPTVSIVDLMRTKQHFSPITPELQK